MSAARIAKTLVIMAVAASRNPTIRAAVRKAPELVSPDKRLQAAKASKRIARKAGEIAGRIIPENKFF